MPTQQEGPCDVNRAPVRANKPGGKPCHACGEYRCHRIECVNNIEWKEKPRWQKR
jgi:hypothetical protein